MSIDSEKVPQEHGTIGRTLRLWPGIAIVSIQWLMWLIIPVVIPGPWIRAAGVLSGIFGGLLVFLWWVFFSRAQRFDRWGGGLLLILVIIVSYNLTDVSITTGMQGMMYFAYAFPVMSLGFLIWAAASRNLRVGPRRLTMVLTILFVGMVWPFLRSDGMSGDAVADFTWRWSETHEERLLSLPGGEMTPGKTATEISGTVTEWPGYRGSDRNNVITGVRIETDWSASPPVEIWRRPVGPGCSSFAVRGDHFYTQEQLGDDEIISCYNLNTGEPVWKYSYEARFWDSHAGAGPRSTPTLSNGKVYALGATGILNVLDAENGSLEWSRSAALDTEVDTPGWGFTSSPLVVEDAVIVAISGKLVAYDIITGSPLWFGPEGGESYSSPHLFSMDGIDQVLMTSETGLTSFLPSDGKKLWEHSWPGIRIVQPAICNNGDLMICAGDAKGIRRIAIEHGSDDGWKVRERWTSLRLRPNHNDFVVHGNYAFGIEGPTLACIELEEGKRQWRGGRYGGQILLLPDQDLLLLLSEKGELVLIEALPDKLNELAKYKAIEGKTWNHPVLVRDMLLVRNTEEMAGFKLATIGI